MEDVLPLNETVDELRSDNRPIEPFYWEIEFPEVFTQEHGGFDVIVGNPPFAGKNTLISSHRHGYLDWLKTVHAESHGNAALVAHFYRRAFNVLRKDGCFGLLATNTIGQGDTRSTCSGFACTVVRSSLPGDVINGLAWLRWLLVWCMCVVARYPGRLA